MTSNKHNTELIQYHLDRLTRHHGPVHSIVVTDEILPIGCVMVADDHAAEICNANQLLELLRALPDDAPLGVADAEGDSVWGAIFRSSTASNF